MVIFQNGQVRGFHKAVASQFRLSGLPVSIVMAGLVTLSSCSNSTTLVDPPFVPHYRIIAELEGTLFYLVPASDGEQQVLVALESGPVRPRFDEIKAWNFASNDDTDFHIRSVASSIEANYLAVSVDGVMDSLRLVSFGELSDESTWTITRQSTGLCVITNNFLGEELALSALQDSETPQLAMASLNPELVQEWQFEMEGEPPLVDLGTRCNGVP